MTCLICKITGVCACCFVDDARTKTTGICKLCAGAPYSVENRVEIEEARKRLAAGRK